MRSPFSFNRNTAIINFSAHYCESSEKVLNSKGFRLVLERFIERYKKNHHQTYQTLVECAGKSSFTDYMIKIFKLLLTLEVEEIIQYHEQDRKLFEHREDLTEFIEGLYNYWRRVERYSVIYNRYYGEGLQKVNFIEAIDKFNNVILSTYRTIMNKILSDRFRVYRQLNAGVNAAVVLQKVNWTNQECYEGLTRVLFIDSIILNPPFIMYPKQNKRVGIFEEVAYNPLRGLKLSREEWFCYPALVGHSLAYIFFHKDFMSQGISLGNLFEMAPSEMCKNREPDFIYIFGHKDDASKAVYHHDRERNILIGYVSYDDAFDYFGYMKKMILTLHNVRMIEQGKLPIHGAMVSLKLMNGIKKNIVIIGDSGAGKSESLEALRVLSGDYIKDMRIIFDDMGTFDFDEDGKLLAYGTEIGAFIRLDDLDIGYAYREIDRSIFMNPDKVNARIVIPVTTYRDIIKGYPIDLVLYANNYEEGEELEFFSDVEEAKGVFIQGARRAKGTTSETGLVKTFFANPFGPLQRKSQTRKLIDRYFNALFQQNIQVGQIRTRLALQGQEHDGPIRVAGKLFQYISKEAI